MTHSSPAHIFLLHQYTQLLIQHLHLSASQTHFNSIHPKLKPWIFLPCSSSNAFHSPTFYPVAPARSPEILYSYHPYPINLWVLSFWPPKCSFNMSNFPIPTAILSKPPPLWSEVIIITCLQQQVFLNLLIFPSTLSSDFSQSDLSNMKILLLKTFSGFQLALGQCSQGTCLPFQISSSYAITPFVL